MSYACSPAARPSGKKQLITGLNRPCGLAFWQNYLYVAETNSVRSATRHDAKALTAGAGQRWSRFRAAAITGRARSSSIARDRR